MLMLMSLVRTRLKRSTHLLRGKIEKKHYTTKLFSNLTHFFRQNEGLFANPRAVLAGRRVYLDYVYTRAMVSGFVNISAFIITSRVRRLYYRGIRIRRCPTLRIKCFHFKFRIHDETASV